MRTWRRITFSIGNLDPDPLVTRLHDLGTLGVETRDTVLIAWFEESVRAADLEQRLGGCFGVAGAAAIVDDRIVSDERWHERWMQRQVPFACGGRFLVVPGEGAPPEAPAGRLVLRVPPGRAFGTGEHATTRLCLGMIERVVAAGSSMLDVGTGTGILAIAAWLLGARPVVAIDGDAEAVLVARRNAALSGAGGGAGIRLAACAVESLRGGAGRGRFTTIAANLDTPTLHRAFPVLASLAPRHAILSGVLEADAAGVATLAGTLGYEVAERADDGEWVALRCVPRP